MSAKKHILIAEDEKRTQLSLALILKGAGYTVTTVEDGAEAFETIKESYGTENRPDLLLTDIKMPGISGLDLAGLLKKTDVSIPVVAMTGFGNKETVVRLLKSGCRDYIEKPFSGEELLECIETVFHDIERENAGKSNGGVGFGNNETVSARDIRTYKLNLERLSEQFESAVDIYHKLVEVSPEDYDIPFAWENRPLADLGGDFIGIESGRDGYDILVADVAGHDLGSSFHTILIKAFFEENARKANDGPTLFYLLNRHLRESEKNERMITALFLRIDLKAMTGDIVTAGHPPLIHFSGGPDGERRSLSTNGMVLGIYDQVEFESLKFELDPGDRLFLYTYGVTGVSRLDTSDERMKLLSDHGLERILASHRSLPLAEMVSRAWSDVLAFCDAKPNDDMLLAGIEIPGKRPPGVSGEGKKR